MGIDQKLLKHLGRLPEDLLRDLIDLPINQVQDILNDIDFVSWCESNRILEGEPFRLTGGAVNMPYMIPIYRDPHPRQTYKKSRQMGASELATNKAINVMDTKKRGNVIYIMPTQIQANEFSEERFKGAIEESPILKSNIVKNEVKHKSYIYDGSITNHIYFIGARGSKKDQEGDKSRGKTKVALVIYDERQDQPEDIEGVVGETQEWAEDPQSLSFGTPKLPGGPLETIWSLSDRKVWSLKCPFCRHDQELTEENILGCDNYHNAGSRDRAFYGCKKCGQPIDIYNSGRWISLSPGNKLDYSGYHITQLLRLPASKILEKKSRLFKKYKKRRYFNEVLGREYGGDSIPFPKEMTKANIPTDPPSWEYGNSDYTRLISVGVDWGKESYITVKEFIPEENRVKLLYTDTITLSDERDHDKEVAKVIRKFKAKICIVDKGYSKDRDKNLAELFPGRVYACEYTGPIASQNEEDHFSFNSKTNIVKADRSWLIEEVQSRLQERSYILPGYDERLSEFIDHLANITSERVKDRRGNEYYMYDNMGPDHYAHAGFYSMLGIFYLTIHAEKNKNKIKVRRAR